MVLIMIRIKCELENLTNLRPEEDFTYFFNVECSSCREVCPRESAVTAGETSSTSSGVRQKSSGTTKTAEANLVQKCDFCSRTGTISLVPGHGRPYMADDSEHERFVPLLLLDCRGMEPVQYSPRDGWIAEGAETGTKFAEIDLTEGDFSEYDVKAKQSVGVYKFTAEFVKTKL
eukprot:TRINITY_DN775_c0_g1_i1.p1 TRINITY_DN775_c0_g1~~TRINITY_DN775_c0_g1_i1.p1  ORF type:complete len:174 (+),score=33.16 TRINITY_DN775_c0_g1_i1:645-1166(+)